MSPELKEAIHNAAEKNKRSMNAEICARLEQSLQSDALIEGKDLNDPMVMMQESVVGIERFLNVIRKGLTITEAKGEK